MTTKNQALPRVKSLRAYFGIGLLIIPALLFSDALASSSRGSLAATSGRIMAPTGEDAMARVPAEARLSQIELIVVNFGLSAQGFLCLPSSATFLRREIFGLHPSLYEGNPGNSTVGWFLADGEFPQPILFAVEGDRAPRFER